MTSFIDCWFIFFICLVSRLGRLVITVAAAVLNGPDINWKCKPWFLEKTVSSTDGLLTAHQHSARWMFWKIQDRTQIKNTDIKHDPEKCKQRKRQQNKTSLFQSPWYNIWPENETGLFYNAPEPTQRPSETAVFWSDFLQLIGIPVLKHIW